MLTAMVPQQAGKETTRVASIAMLAAVVSLFLFSPRFFFWREMEIPILPDMPPEVARAKFAVMQLRHPFMQMDNHISLVLRWRLFFPLLGHALSLSPSLYFALSPVGCLLVLVYTVALLRRHAIDWPDCLAAAILAATCSWFFVSTGWLAYFDSWYVLGLLLLSFSRGLWPAVVAVLITPWIDERFVIMLPLAMILRREYATVVSGGRPVGMRELRWLSIAFSPWILLRAGFFIFTKDHATTGYIKDAFTQHGFAIKYYLMGLWQSMRCAWIFVSIWLGLGYRRGIGKIILIPVFFITLIFSLIVAEDISRSISMFMPLVLMGIILCKIYWSGYLRPVLFVACALNLLLPAAHVAGNGVTMIRNFYYMLDEGHPEEDLMAYYYNEMAIMYVKQGHPKDALQMIDLSIQRDPTHVECYSNRATIYADLGFMREALADADYIVKRKPGSPDAWFDRGILRIKNGDLNEAAADFERATRCAPDGWAKQSAAQSILKQLLDKISGEDRMCPGIKN